MAHVRHVEISKHRVRMRKRYTLKTLCIQFQAVFWLVYKSRLPYLSNALTTWFSLWRCQIVELFSSAVSSKIWYALSMLVILVISCNPWNLFHLHLENFTTNQRDTAQISIPTHKRQIWTDSILMHSCIWNKTDRNKNHVNR